MKDWEAAYQADPCIHGTEPSRFLRDHLHLLPRGRALDVAMGEGRNALFLAEHGWTVTGIDRSPTAVARARAQAASRGIDLEGVVADLESHEIPPGGFDLVVVFNYLERSLFPALEAALKPGGALVYETYTVDHQKYRTMNPDYLLRPNELLHAFLDLRILLYREIDLHESQKCVASLIGLK